MPPPHSSSPDRPPNRPIWSLETIGFILLAIFILIFTIIRYRGHIPWGAR